MPERSYVCTRYSLMATDSHSTMPVLGSSMQGTRPLGLRSVNGGFFTSSGSTNRFSYGRLSSSRIMAHFQGFVPSSFDFKLKR